MNDHPLIEGNVSWRTKRGKRYAECKRCRADASRRYRARAKEAA